MTHGDRVGGSSGRRKGAGDAVHRQNFSTPSENLGKPSLWVMINAPWYYPPAGRPGVPRGRGATVCTPLRFPEERP